MMKYGPLVNGEIITDGCASDVLSPIDGSAITTVHGASEEIMHLALESLRNAFSVTCELSSFQKSSILLKVSELIAIHKERLADLITAESGKPITASLAEVDRAVATFAIASEEAKRIYGEIIPLDTSESSLGRKAEYNYFPRGVVSGITPFNFPLNLVAHKVAPALAAGCPIIIKPAPQTPLSAIELGKLVIEAGWPKSAIAIIPCENDVAKHMVTDSCIKFFSFTGSDTVGWYLKSLANKVPVTLELGGNAANIIHQDADLERAINRTVWGGLVQSGQTCVSVQRVFVHESHYKQVKDLLLEAIRDITSGDPRQFNTFVGPLISEEAAMKVERVVNSSLEGGAKCLIGGRRVKSFYEPTLLESDDDTLAIHSEEVFGPVMVISKYKDFSSVVDRVNASKYGLQAGLFTNDQRLIQYAYKHIEVGGLNINDVSTFRMDSMPYGGVKDSGCGREGVRYAIREMMYRKLMTY